MNNPKTRTAFQRLLKTANPDISLPEIELEARAAAAFDAQNKKLEALEAEREKDKAQAGANALYEALRDERVVTSRTDFHALVKYAHEKGFQTSEAGLRMAQNHRAAELEAAEPTPAAINGVDGLKPVSKELIKNPTQWARDQAALALKDIEKQRKGQRRAA